ncbi:MAG: hypothetical protein ACRBEE_11775 [Arenicella sp.]
MTEFYKLISTYDVVLEFSTNTRPVRIEVLKSIDNPKKLRARVWDQITYDLNPTFASFENKCGERKYIYSSDEINREITTILSGDESSIDIFFGKEWESEQEFLNYLKGLLNEYHKSLV